MPERHELETAAATMTLGRVVDQALLGVLRIGHGESPGDRERKALELVRKLLLGVDKIRKAGVVVPPGLQMAFSVDAIEETVEAVTAAERGDGGIVAGASTIAKQLGKVLAGNRSDELVSSVTGFLERLADITLSRADDLANESARRSPAWTKTTLHS